MQLTLLPRIIDTVRGEPSIGAFTQSARSESELLAKAKGPLGATVVARYTKLQEVLSSDEAFVPKKALPTLQERLPRIEAVAKAIQAVQLEPASRTSEQQAAIDALLAKTVKIWDDELPKLLAVFEKEIVGPLCLGASGVALIAT